jgi:hypothetical protein
LIAEAVYPIFDILQGALDSSHIQLLTAAKVVRKFSLGNLRGSIEKIRQIVIRVFQPIQAAVGSI